MSADQCIYPQKHGRDQAWWTGVRFLRSHPLITGIPVAMFRAALHSGCCITDELGLAGLNNFGVEIFDGRSSRAKQGLPRPQPTPQVQIPLWLVIPFLHARKYQFRHEYPKVFAAPSRRYCQYRAQSRPIKWETNSRSNR